MKVFTKGMLLVSVPLALQLIVVTTMSIMLWHANSQAVYESNAKDIVADCNELLQHITVIIKQGSGFDADVGSISDSGVKLLQDDVTSIRQKLSAEKQRSQELRRMTNEVSDVIPFLRRLKTREYQDGRNANRPERKLFLMLDKFYDSVWAIIRSVESVHIHDPEERAKTEAAIRFALLGFTVLSILVSIALTYFAAISLKRPVERMVSNAVSIARRSPLEPPLTGDDELSNLDQLLHEVDTSITIALNSERNMIANAADLICSVDAVGAFRSANPHSIVLLGYEPDDLVEHSLLDFVVSEDCDKVDQILTSKSVKSEPINSEVRMVKRDQTVVDTVWSVVWSEKDKSFFCVIHDITERKNIERLKQDFLAMISHDLRTPLMSVHSTFELVSNGVTGAIPSIAQIQLASAMRSTEHLIELVNDLLDFEKLEAGRMTFDISRFSTFDAIDESLQLVKALSDQRRIHIEVPSESSMVMGDQRKLVQVLVNLLSNALKHSPESGKIRITIERREGQVYLNVHDEGPGVPEEYRSSIFAPFEQISHRSTAKLGTGLGLAICRLIAEGNGGAVGVTHSSLLKGSCFYISLPVANLTEIA